jgi:hypothetical protein
VIEGEAVVLRTNPRVGRITAETLTVHVASRRVM